MTARVRAFPPGSPERTALVIMAKAPAPGRTKTRLCPPLTHEQAARLHAALLRDTLDLAADVPAADRVVFHPGGPAETRHLERLAPPGCTVVPQRGAGLGSGLAEAIELGCAAGFGRVVALDSDSPTVPAAYLRKAIALLEEHDAVLGPCEDGGYYLIGLSRPEPRLFEGISWSTDQVLAQTRAAAAALGMRLALLPHWYDVDGMDDLLRLHRDLAATPSSAPATWAVLQELTPAALQAQGAAW